MCVCVFVRARVRASALRRLSFERSYVGCQGCVLLRVLFQRALPRAAEVLPEAVGAHPQFCVSATKERIGAFREERKERQRRRGGWFDGGCQPGYVTAMWVVVYTLIRTHTQPQSRLVLGKLFLYTLYCWHAPSKIPCFGGEF